MKAVDIHYVSDIVAHPHEGRRFSYYTPKAVRHLVDECAAEKQSLSVDEGEQDV
jgi:hypothetical protein